MVAPTSHLKVQWSLAAHRLGLQLDPDWSPGDGLARDVHGLVTTYQQIATGNTAAKLAGLSADGFVILDEIHHAGHDKAWGDGIRVAFGHAARRLSLSGTPFRSDAVPDPVRALRRDRRGRHGPRRLHLRLRRRLPRRRGGAPGLLPAGRRRDGVDAPRRAT